MAKLPSKYICPRSNPEIPGSISNSLSQKWAGHVSTQIPRIYSYPIVLYPYLPPPGPFPGATSKSGFVPEGFPFKTGNQLLLGGRPGDQSVRGRWWRIVVVVP